MMRGKVWALVASAVMLVACGDDDPNSPPEPDLSREDVAGAYDLTTLSFDPQGSLPVVDLLARVDFAQTPELILAANEDSLQLIFRIDGELLRLVRGGYDLGDDGLTVELATSVEAADLLLLQEMPYDFDETASTLHFSGTIQADTARLFELVPEWSGEPVTSPLPGTFSVTWTRDG